jgi:hypothetical protein
MTGVIPPPCDCASQGSVTYSIATLVNDSAQHAALRASFEAGGFAGPDCEYLPIDNTGPVQTGAYRGLNEMLNAARGAYVILCHQDVRLIADGRAELDARLAELETLDPGWALAGNAGGVAPGRLAIRITDPHGTDRHVGALPARVTSLDENFIVVKRSARVGFSRDLDGFHFYGADICLVADILGYSAYVIDFHLRHLSAGAKSAAFSECEAAFRAKWSRALRARWMQTTCSLMKLSGDPLGRTIGRVAEGAAARFSRRLPRAAGFGRRPA